MKILTRDDLILLLSIHKNNTFSFDDLERILYYYGDDWSIEGNKWIKTKENEKMAALRKRIRDENDILG